MNILLLNWRDPRHPLAGGAEISLHEHAKYWQKKGAKITWFASSFPGANQKEEIDGITYIRKGSHFTIHMQFFLHWLTGKEQDRDVIIDCFHFLPFFTPLYLNNKKVIALINEVAGKVWYSNLPYPLAWVGYYIEPFFFRFYKYIPFITASNSAKEELIKVGVPSDHITIVPHGVILEKVDPKVTKESMPTIIFLNRISKDKGIEDVMKAFLKLKKKISLKLWIVGKEESKGELERVFAKVQVTDEIRKDITYYGFVDQKKKFELLKRAWVLVHPSKKEGWGLTVIEAASQGTPTVGYNVDGLRDSIKDRETGLLVDENSVALSEGIKELFSNKKLYSILSKNAKEWSEEFKWSESGEKSWRLIKSIYEK